MKKIFLIIIILFFNSCNTQNKRISEKRTINVVLNSIGKTNKDKNLIAAMTGINKSNLTTNLYYYDNSKNIIGLLINDEVFNYDYFNSKIYYNIENKRVKLYLDVYKNKSKEVLIIRKIK